MTATIWTVANGKGGVGKSTVSSNLAVFLAHMGRTWLVNSDKQKTINRWITWRYEQNVPHSPKFNILLDKMVRNEILGDRQNFDHVVIDTTGADSVGGRYALGIANHIIIPVGLDDAETVELKDYKEILDEVLVYNPEAQIRVVMNCVDQRRSQKEIQEAREFIESMGLELYDTIIYQYAAIPHRFGAGLTMVDNIDNIELEQKIRDRMTQPNATKQVMAFLDEVMTKAGQGTLNKAVGE